MRETTQQGNARNHRTPQHHIGKVLNWVSHCGKQEKEGDPEVCKDLNVSPSFYNLRYGITTQGSVSTPFLCFHKG